MYCTRCHNSGWLNSGPSGQPKCPKCQNSSQNAEIWNDPNSRRCASCKTVWVPVRCDCEHSKTTVQVQYGVLIVSCEYNGYSYESNIPLQLGDVVMVPENMASKEPQVATVVSLKSDYTGKMQSVIRLVARKRDVDRQMWAVELKRIEESYATDGITPEKLNRAKDLLRLLGKNTEKNNVD